MGGQGFGVPGHQSLKSILITINEAPHCLVVVLIALAIGGRERVTNRASGKVRVIRAHVWSYAAKCHRHPHIPAESSPSFAVPTDGFVLKQ
jgi:hypothetical protein